ncbi:MAG: UDP-2,3-diacylglucosamine hydrolase [Acidimicrobiales bacterium]|nr:MAG: UDP-2,3-diacylglucosamine hydrolase [Acidimicrobiales bacterium]
MAADATFAVKPGATVTFFGDVHLGDGGRNDLFRGKDAMLVDALDRCAREDSLVVFMGDFFDLPQAFRTRRIERAHPAVVHRIRRLCEETAVVILRGNHDWLVDYPSVFPGASVTEELQIDGLLVCHGHRFDPKANVESWRYFAAMALHTLFERAARFDFRVPVQQFDSFPNRLMHWLAHRYARLLRRTGLLEDSLRYWSREVWGDPGSMWEPLTGHLRESRVPAIVCGHSHLPGVVDVDGHLYVNAGSWAFESAQVARWDGREFVVLDLASGRTYGDEHYRWLLERVDPGDLFDWWRVHYLGRLRFAPQRDPREVHRIASPR